MSSSGWECAPGPCVCGSRRHSEMEYALSVSSPSALKTALMRPIGYERPAPGGRKTPARFVELSWMLTYILLCRIRNSRPTRNTGLERAADMLLFSQMAHQSRNIIENSDSLTP